MRGAWGTVKNLDGSSRTGVPCTSMVESRKASDQSEISCSALDAGRSCMSLYRDGAARVAAPSSAAMRAACERPGWAAGERVIRGCGNTVDSVCLILRSAARLNLEVYVSYRGPPAPMGLASI